MLYTSTPEARNTAAPAPINTRRFRRADLAAAATWLAAAICCDVLGPSPLLPPPTPVAPVVFPERVLRVSKCGSAEIISSPDGPAQRPDPNIFLAPGPLVV